MAIVIRSTAGATRHAVYSVLLFEAYIGRESESRLPMIIWLSLAAVAVSTSGL